MKNEIRFRDCNLSTFLCYQHRLILMHIYQSSHDLRIPGFLIKLLVYHFRVHE